MDRIINDEKMYETGSGLRKDFPSGDYIIITLKDDCESPVHPQQSITVGFYNNDNTVKTMRNYNSIHKYFKNRYIEINAPYEENDLYWCQKCDKHYPAETGCPIGHKSV